MEHLDCPPTHKRPLARLTVGIASYVEYQFQCGKGLLFSEKYLAEPIGNILQSAFGYKVIAEYNHPHIKNEDGGRPLQIDFVGFNDEKLVLAIESKWFGKKKISKKDWLWDCYRLALIKAKHPDATCALCAVGLNGIKVTDPVIRSRDADYKQIRLDEGDKRYIYIKSKIQEYSIDVKLKRFYIAPPVISRTGRSSDSWRAICWEIGNVKIS